MLCSCNVFYSLLHEEQISVFEEVFTLRNHSKPQFCDFILTLQLT